MDDLKEELFASIKDKLSEIESIEEEINEMYAEIETLQYDAKEFKSKSIERMKQDLSQCFIELETFIKNKKNELLVKVNDLKNESSDDEKTKFEVNNLKESTQNLLFSSTKYLNDKMAEYELLKYNEHTLSELDNWFNLQTMDAFNKQILSLNKLIDTVSVKQCYKFNLNSVIYKSVLNNIVNVGVIETFVPSKDGNLILNKGQRVELKSNYQYEFNAIHLKENSKLTVKSWNSKLKNGGMLFIKCLGKLILEKNSKITLSYKGYKGGNNGFQGESFHGIGNQKLNKNNDGGGGTGISGGGGGFGEFGVDGKYSNGGCDYGDDLLTSMYMGSGGGASEKCNGGNGGGCVWIYCLNDIELSENALINASGQDGFDANLLEKGGGGGGSGGSIYIECNKLKLASTSKILAIGGKGGKAIKPFGHDGGHGGDGRICIKVKGANSIGYTQNIRPKPYIEYN